MEGISQDTINVLKSSASALDQGDLDKLCQLVYSEAQTQGQGQSSSSTTKVLSTFRPTYVLTLFVTVTTSIILDIRWFVHCADNDGR